MGRAVQLEREELLQSNDLQLLRRLGGGSVGAGVWVAGGAGLAERWVSAARAVGGDYKNGKNSFFSLLRSGVPCHIRGLTYGLSYQGFDLWFEDLGL